MTTYAVEYIYDTTRDAQRNEFRSEHRAFFSDLFTAGTLLISGPWIEADVPGALLIMVGDSPEEILATLEADPFRREGVIAECSVRAWEPVIGLLNS